MVEVYLHYYLPHVSALDNSHLQVVHESLETSYTSDSNVYWTVHHCNS